MKIFIEHAKSRQRCDQLGYWTAEEKRWHDFKAFLPALQLWSQRHLANAQILVMPDEGAEVRLDLPTDSEFDGAEIFPAVGARGSL